MKCYFDRIFVNREWFFAFIPEIEVWHFATRWYLHFGWLLWSIEIRLKK